MTKKDIGLQGGDSRENVAARWAAFLHTQYGTRHAAKRISRDFDIENRTAKSWLTGEVTPQLDSFMAAARLFGIAAVLGVLFPDTEEFQQQKLKDDLSLLRSQLDRLSHKLGALADDEIPEKNRPRSLPDDGKGTG
jgi:Mg2+ and Co2+ transporter CorA